jgi:small subunit ribosomal protein S1
MSIPDKSDPNKQKFRPVIDSALDREIEDALAGLTEEDLYGVDKLAASAGAKGPRKGRVLSIGKEEVFIDFGGKSQGVVPILQFEELPKVGEELEFNVERYDAREGILILTRKGAVATDVSWDSLEVGQIVEGTVTAVNKGGLELEVKSLRAFMPAGQTDLYHVPDLNQFMGQKMQAEIIEVQRESKNLLVSRRNVLEREREALREKLWAEIAEGQIRRGTVRSVMDFGAFVDLGGLDGLVHVSELSFRRVRNANELVKVGDVLDVVVLKIDREAKKLSLSLKQARGNDPWLDAAAKYSVMTPVTGRVTRVENFGAFIEVEEGIEGLLPVSEISYQRINHPTDRVKENDTLRLVVLSVDPAARRMSFSLKQAGPDPWKTVNERYQTDSVVPGTITRLADFGAFVELEPGLEGLIHMSELSDGRFRAAKDVVKIGQLVHVRVLQIDAEGRRISLSLKNATPPPVETAAAAPTGKPKKRPPLRGGLDY